MKGTPFAMLVDPAGTILYQGDPREMDEELITSALSASLQVPLYDWPADLDAAKAAFQSGQLADALTKAEANSKVAEAVRGMIDARVGRVRDAAASGDWLTVDERASELADAIKGLPAETEVRGLLKELKSDKDAKKALKAQRQIAKLFEKKIGSSKVDSVLKKVEKIAAGFPAESGVGRDAAKAKSRLEALRK